MKSTSGTPTEKNPDTDERSTPLILCAAAGALTSVLLVHFLVASADLVPLFVAGIAGAVGGIAVEPIFESLVVSVLLALVCVAVTYALDDSLLREVVVAIAAGVAMGKFVGSVVYEILDSRHKGRS